MENLISIDKMQNYTRIKSIGQGSFSVVFHVIENETNQSYAMKILSQKYSSIEQVKNNEEIALMAHIGQHKNIVNLHEVIFEPSKYRLSLVLDLMDKSLLDYVVKERKGKLSIQESLMYTFQLLTALEHMHSRGVIHRDIKPENCFINPQNMELKLGDFGSARNLISDRELTEYITTRWYRPPECLLTKGLYGPPIDIWAVGCILYELLTGNPLFPGKTQIDQINRIHRILGSPSQEELKKLCPNPDKRRTEINFVEYEKPRNEFETRLAGFPIEVIDLLKKLLVYLPSDRITALDALKHEAFNLIMQGNQIMKRIIVSSEPNVEFVVPTALQNEPLNSRIRDDTGVIPTTSKKFATVPQVFVPSFRSNLTKAQQRRRLIVTPPKEPQPVQPTTSTLSLSKTQAPVTISLSKAQGNATTLSLAKAQQPTSSLGQQSSMKSQFQLQPLQPLNMPSISPGPPIIASPSPKPANISYQLSQGPSIRILTSSLQNQTQPKQAQQHHPVFKPVGPIIKLPK